MALSPITYYANWVFIEENIRRGQNPTLSGVLRIQPLRTPRSPRPGTLTGPAACHRDFPVVYFSQRATETEEPDMMHIDDAVRRLVFSGAFTTQEDARQAVMGFIKGHGVLVDANGYIDAVWYDDIVAELKG